MVVNVCSSLIIIRSILVWSILNSLTELVSCDEPSEVYTEAPDTMKGDDLWLGIEMPQTSYFEGISASIPFE
jgi:hypothetical protein